MTGDPADDPKVQLRSARPGEDDEALRALFGAAFGTTRSSAFLDWKYRQNPAGPAEITLAWVDGVPASMACLLPVRMRVGGEQVLGTQSVDIATRPEYRGRGLYAAAARSLWSRVAGEGVALTFGFTNRFSTRLTLDALGRREVGPLPLRMRPLRPLAAVASLSRGGKGPALALPAAPPQAEEIERVVQLDARFDELWERIAPRVDIACVRDAAYLEWRYARHPEFSYEILAWPRSGALRGYLVWRPVARFGLQTAFVCDLATAPDDSQAARLLLRTAARRARGVGAQALALLSWPGSPAHGACARATLPVPRLLFPQTNVFSVISHRTTPSTQALCTRERWWIGWGDSDVV